MKESDLQKKIIDYSKAAGAYVKNNWGSGVSEPGVSDLTICYKGLYLSIEVKKSGGKPTEQQMIHLRNVSKAGGIAQVIDNIDDYRTLLARIDDYAENIKRFNHVKGH